MNNFQIIDYSNEYFQQLYELQIQQWGEGSDSDEIFSHIDNYLIKLVLSKDLLVGCSICHIIDKKTLYLDMIVISPEFQNKGIGTKLLTNVIDYAKTNGFCSIECSAIEANGHTNSKKLLENFGFECIDSVDNYWGKLCPDFFCKECGQKPCVCTMHKYIKKLK